MARIGVVGLGVMGLGIAQVFAQAGHEVVASDGYASARDTAHARMRAAIEPRVAAGKTGAEDMHATLDRFRICEAPEDLASADLVIEAVAERLDAKVTLLRGLEVAGNAVLATNTSSLSATRIAEGLDSPNRLIGLHFFNPAPAMKLVELIGTEHADDSALALGRDLAQSAGKTVIDCADSPGFIVNRCARPFYGEAFAFQAEGRDPVEIDAAMRAAGYRLGPFALIDLVGADINLAATESLYAAMGQHPRYHVFPALRDQVAKGALGLKSGRGFVHPAVAAPTPADAPEIVSRIEAMMINEAAFLLGEGGATRDGIDTALRLGLNFPRGPFEMLHAHGQSRVVETLSRLRNSAPEALKPRYHPAPALARQA